MYSPTCETELVIKITTFCRKLYLDLCQGSLRHCIRHPTQKDKYLYLLFDFTHCLKNIFNNFLNKNRMHLPSTGYEAISGDFCVAEFSHIKRLYALEKHKTLKIAHKLKKNSLNPRSIARTSPLHAFSKYSCCKMT